MILIQFRVQMLSTWKVYPRVQFLRNRYIDVYKRFNHACGMFPKSFHAEGDTTQELVDELRMLLEKEPIVLITEINLRKEDISTSPISFHRRASNKSDDDSKSDAYKRYDTSKREVLKRDDVRVTQVNQREGERDEYSEFLKQFIERAVFQSDNAIIENTFKRHLIIREDDSASALEKQRFARILNLSEPSFVQYDIPVGTSKDRLQVKIDVISISRPRHIWYNEMYEYFWRLDRQLGEGRRHVDIIVVDTEETDDIYKEAIKNDIECIMRDSRLTKRQGLITVLYFPDENKLKLEIEKIIEERITCGFEQMFSYLNQHFVRKSTPYDPGSVNILSRHVVTCIVKDALNGANADKGETVEQSDADRSSIDANVMSIICRKLLCAMVPTMAAKYVIPEAICHHLLLELDFQNDIRQAVREETRQAMAKLCDVKKEKDVTYGLHAVSSKTVSPVVGKLRNDLLKKASIFKKIDRNFKTAQRVTTVMKKISLEVKGYLRQSLVHSTITDMADIENPRPIIPLQLRKDILSDESVYGMGTIYGRLEIHLRPKVKLDPAIKNRIAKHIQKHHYPYPYHVKVVDHEIKPYFKQGVKTYSPFPNDNKCEEFRIGTVGCFVKDDNRKPYILTCAHAVSPGNKDAHTVLADRNGKKHRFGLSTRDKTICSGDNGTFPVVDIAAVGAFNEKKITEAIDYKMRDDSGESKSVAFACDLSLIPDGTVLYKHGGMTSLTYGTKVSSDYTTSETLQQAVTPDEYIMLIESTSSFSDHLDLLGRDRNSDNGHQSTNVPVQPFSKEGDSGAFICYNDYMGDPNGTIIAVAMLNGGNFTPKERGNKAVNLSTPELVEESTLAKKDQPISERIGQLTLVPIYQPTGEQTDLFTPFRPLDQPTGEQVDQSTLGPMDQPTGKQMCKSIHGPKDQPTGEQMCKSIHGPMDQPTGEQMGQINNEPMDLGPGEQVDQSTLGLMDKPTGEQMCKSIYGPMDQPTGKQMCKSIHEPMDQPTDEQMCQINNGPMDLGPREQMNYSALNAQRTGERTPQFIERGNPSGERMDETICERMDQSIGTLAKMKQSVPTGQDNFLKPKQFIEKSNPEPMDQSTFAKTDQSTFDEHMDRSPCKRTNSSSVDFTAEASARDSTDESSGEPSLTSAFLLATGLDSLCKKGHTFVM